MLLFICAFVYYKRTKNLRALSSITQAHVPANPANPANPAKASVNPPPAPHADHAVKEEDEVVKGHVYSPA